MKDTTPFPFITVTSSLWLHLRTCLVKSGMLHIKKKKILYIIPVVERSLIKTLFIHKGLGYHQGI